MYSGFCSPQAYLSADELPELRWWPLVLSRCGTSVLGQYGCSQPLATDRPGACTPFPGHPNRESVHPHRRAVFTKSALHCRSRAGSWAGSGDEGAGETKALGSGLCLGLVSDTREAARRRVIQLSTILHHRVYRPWWEGVAAPSGLGVRYTL